MEASEYRVPGWDTYPEHTFSCEECGEETVVSVSFDETQHAACAHCGSDRLKLRYISYPTNGPGFQKGYNPEGLIYGGGAAGSCESNTDIAGLPLNTVKDDTEA